MDAVKFQIPITPLKSICSSAIALGLVFVLSTSLSARNLYQPQDASITSNRSSRTATGQIARVHRMGSFEFTIPDNGTLGSGFAGTATDPITGIALPSFQFPQGSHLEYLFGGALWIGAIAGEDTLVSMATDGWAFTLGMIPSPIEPGVRIVSGFADENFETTYHDSLPPVWNTSNQPGALGITVRQRSLVWNREPNNDFAVIEYHITNSYNADTLKKLFVGLYLDADVGHRSIVGTDGFTDDLTGYLSESGIAYIADNDGHRPMFPEFEWSELSTRAVIGAKILDIKHAGTEPLAPPSYNWWFSNGDASKDFGPRRSGTVEDPFREFEEGALGTPVGERDKYYILSHPEQDYDQIEVALDHTSDGWLAADSLQSIRFAYGFDTRFIISQGGVTLAPGDSMVFVVAIAIGDNFHVNPRDFAETFDRFNPSNSRDRLDFSDLINNIAAAESLYVSGYELPITSPPPAPAIDDTLAVEPLMSWLFSRNPSVEGYDVYLAKAADSSVFCHYALIDTPEFVPEDIVATVSSDTFRLSGLQDGAWYAAAVAVHTLDDSFAPTSEPVVFLAGIPHAPKWDSAMFLNEDQLKNSYVSDGTDVSLQWKTEESDIHHFNIYRTGDTISAFSDLNLVGNGFCRFPFRSDMNVICSTKVNDSAIVCLTSKFSHAEVAGGMRSFTDSPGAPKKFFYGVTAVDSAGNESAMSERLVAYTVPAVRDPLLFAITDSFRLTGTRLPVAREMFDFYRDILAPYNPEFIFRSVLRGDERRWPPLYSEIGKYKTLIVEGSRTVLWGNTRVGSGESHWALDFVRSGGTIVQVGIHFASTSSPLPKDLVTSVYPDSQDGSVRLGREIFGLDSVIMVPAPTGDVLFDSVNLFYRPLGALAASGSGFPDLSYHHSGLYLAPPEYTTGPIPNKGVVFPLAENTEVLYTWVSGRDTASNFEGLPIGVKYTPASHTAYVLISSPWEWEPDQARDFFAKIMGDIQTDVASDDEVLALPETFALSQNYPNPFNPTTQISYSVPSRSQVTLQVYNILGQKVRTLVNEVKEAGEHVVSWDASEVASGMYFYRLSTGEVKLSRKMILLK